MALHAQAADRDSGPPPAGAAVLRGGFQAERRSRPSTASRYTWRWRSQLLQLLELGAVAVDLEAEAGDVVDAGDGLDDRGDAVALLERAMADQLEAAVGRRREALRVEHSLVRSVEHDDDLRRRRAATDEGFAHLIGARRHQRREADAGLLEQCEHPHRPTLLVDAELGGEELRHALVQVEEHRRARQ